MRQHLTFGGSLACAAVLLFACTGEPGDSPDGVPWPIDATVQTPAPDSAPVDVDATVGPPDASLDAAVVDALPLDMMQDAGEAEPMDAEVTALIDGADVSLVTDQMVDESVVDAQGQAAPVPACGNGRLDALEQCDDGNLENGDGCDRACTRERFEISKSEVVLNEAVVPGTFDHFWFQADGASVLRFRVTGEDGCLPADLLQVRAIGVNGVADVEFVERPALNQECPWREAEIEAGRLALEIANVTDRAVPYILNFRLERPVAPNGIYRGQISENGDDLYALTLEDAQLLRFETESLDGRCNFDSWITLSRVDGGERDELDFNRNGPEGSCSAIQAGLAPGDYLISVREANRRSIPRYQFVVLTAGECGDGRLNLREECDDGNDRDDDECSNACVIQSVCGNLVVEDGETCDDGNLVPGDGCDAVCQQEPTCGNGRLDPREECDDENQENGDGCDAQCSLEEFTIAQGQTIIRSQFAMSATDTFYFEADGPAQLTVSTRDVAFACRPSADTLLELYGLPEDAARVFLIGNDNDPANPPCSRFSTEVGEGSHAIVVSEVANRLSVDSYLLVFRLVRDITAAASVDGTFPDGGDDRYTFSVNQPTRVSVAARPAGQRCLNPLALRFHEENAVAPLPIESVRVNGCARLSALLEPGEYDLSVYTPDQSAVNQYTLDLEWDVEP